MTELSREEVRRLAIEAGFNPAEKHMKHYRGTISDLERFAAAANERIRELEKREDFLNLMDRTQIKRIGLLEIQLTAERAVSDRLLEALKRVVGDHNAPNDCYATGPLTGDTYQDLVACPSCQAESLIAEVEAMRKEKPE